MSRRRTRNMTFDEMKERAWKVAEALNASPHFQQAEVIESDLTEGEPLPVSFVDNQGSELVVDLGVL